MPERKTLNEDLFYEGSSANLPRLHTRKNIKSRFGILKNLPFHRVYWCVLFSFYFRFDVFYFHFMFILNSTNNYFFFCVFAFVPLCMCVCKNVYSFGLEYFFDVVWFEIYWQLHFTINFCVCVYVYIYLYACFRFCEYTICFILRWLEFIYDVFFFFYLK